MTRCPMSTKILAWCNLLPKRVMRPEHVFYYLLCTRFSGFNCDWIWVGTWYNIIPELITRKADGNLRTIFLMYHNIVNDDFWKNGWRVIGNCLQEKCKELAFTNASLLCTGLMSRPYPFIRLYYLRVLILAIPVMTLIAKNTKCSMRY